MTMGLSPRSALYPNIRIKGVILSFRKSSGFDDSRVITHHIRTKPMDFI
jgi:hypothetical protein